MRIDSSIRGRRKRRWNNNIIITIFIPIIFFKQFNFIAMKIFSCHFYYILVRKNPIFRRFPSKDSKDIPEKNFLNVISFTIIVHRTVKRERNYSFSLDIVQEFSNFPRKISNVHKDVFHRWRTYGESNLVTPLFPRGRSVETLSISLSAKQNEMIAKHLGGRAYFLRLPVEDRWNNVEFPSISICFRRIFNTTVDHHR